MKPEILKWVRMIVLRVTREKHLPSGDMDTLFSAGCLGYTQALKRFDPGRNVKFKTFAEFRIKGAVLDEVRKIIGDERCKNKRPAQVDYDVSDLEESHESTVEADMDVKRFFEAIPIGDRDKEILQCRVDGMNLREIGDHFGFSESRASQLLAEIKKEIYPWFKQYLSDGFAIVTRRCSACGADSEMIERATSFICDMCGAEVKA